MFQDGKRMVPGLEVVLSGLNDKQFYEITLEFIQIGNDKFTVKDGKWTVRKNAAEHFNRFRGDLIITI